MTPQSVMENAHRIPRKCFLAVLQEHAVQL
jgi:hypothetical protein